MSGDWRTAWQATAQAAAPYMARAADKLNQSAKQSTQPRPARPDGPPATVPTPKPGDAERLPPSNRPFAPNVTERAARTAGAFGGYATRQAVGTVSEPAAQVWNDRPDLPTWQKVLGVPGWLALGLTPHGWLFLAITFFVMVVQGRHTPFSWASWITKWSGLFLLATVILAAIVFTGSSINN